MAEYNKFQSQRLHKKWKNAQNRRIYWIDRSKTKAIKECDLFNRREISVSLEELSHPELLYSHRSWDNFESEEFCESCQTQREQSALSSFDPLIKTSSRNRNRRRGKRRRRKQTTHDQFAAYWQGMKAFQSELEALALWRSTKVRKPVKKIPLNFRIVLVNDPEFFPVEHIVCRKSIASNPHFPNSHDFWLYLVRDPHGPRFNFRRVHCPVVNLIGKTYSRPRSSKFQRRVKQWITEFNLTKERFIKECLKGIPGFGYYTRPKQFESLNEKPPCPSNCIDIKMSIKLQPFAGGSRFEYVRDTISTGNDSLYHKVPCKLSNFTVMECAISIKDPSAGWQKPMVLRTELLANPVHIPIHIAKLESANQAIARTQELQTWPLMRFARQCVNTLIPSLKEPIMFQLEQCHSPQCNLLPLTCDLDRVLNEYLPYYDGLKDILIAYVGYHSLSYIQLTASAVPCSGMPPSGSYLFDPSDIGLGFNDSESDDDDDLFCSGTISRNELDASFALSFSNVHRVECNRIIVEDLLPVEETESSSATLMYFDARSTDTSSSSSVTW